MPPQSRARVGSTHRIPRQSRRRAPGRTPRRTRRRGGTAVARVVALGLLLGTGCRTPPAPAPRPVEGTCAVGPEAGGAPAAAPSGGAGPGEDVRPIRVALSGPVDPAHAPLPHNAAERLVFAQLYQTLVAVGCAGDATPGLASSWEVGGAGRLWTFRLRPGLADWLGRPVTAAEVGEGWLGAGSGVARQPDPVGRSSILEVRALDPLTLSVRVSDSVPATFFALPALAVRTSGSEAGWPVGTGPLRPTRGGSGGASRDGAHRLRGAGEFEVVPSPEDLRTALDGGVDVLVTGERRVLEYARAVPGYRVVPLAWGQTHLLLTPDGGGASRGSPTPPGDGGEPLVLRGSDGALVALARDAVPGEARPALWPEKACRAGAPSGGTRSRRARAALSRRIVYETGDEVARGLAERLAALALVPDGPESSWLSDSFPGLSDRRNPPRAVGLSAGAFGEALRAGRDAAYLVGVSGAAALDPCLALATLGALAPWLVARAPGTEEAPSGGTVTPLVQTRASLVLREGLGGATTDGSGTLSLVGLRRLAREGAR